LLFNNLVKRKSTLKILLSIYLDVGTTVSAFHVFFA